MTRTDYEAFFEAIARQHVAIRHGDGPRVAFDVWEDPNEPLKTAPFVLAWASGFVMVLEHYELSLRANQSGLHVSRYPSGFYLVAVPGSEGRTLRTIQTEAERTARQIWAKLLRDQKAAGGYTTIGGELHLFDKFQGLRCFPVFGFDAGAAGIRAEFQLSQESSLCDEYDATQWLSN